MRYVHKNFKDVYYISRGVYNYQVRKNIGGPSLEMDKQQFNSFLGKLQENGWFESIDRGSKRNAS